MKITGKHVTRVIAASIAILYLGLHAIPHPVHAAELLAQTQMQPANEVVAGDLTISGAFARATLPNAPVAGGFFTVTNHGGQADRLLNATSPAAGAVQLHQMSMEGDVMKMSELPDGIEIPAGGTITLAPSGTHLMFTQLNQAFVEGQSVPVTLTFQKAGPVDIMLSVEGIGAKGPSDPMAM